MAYAVNTAYRKDRIYPAGHGYGRNIGTRDLPIWIGERSGTVIRVIIHATHGQPGTADAAEASYLCHSPDVSAHGLIGRDGTWYEILPANLQAWHSGDCDPDSFENPTSYGIELHAAASEPITAAQKATLEAKLLELRREYGIGAPDVRSHRSVAVPPGRKSDPGTWSDTDLNRWVSTIFSTALSPDPIPGALTPYTADSPIVAPPRGTQAGYVAALQRRCAGSPHYAFDAIAEIANVYWLICGASGVDPWLAAAQMCHETGNLSSWFCARPRRNPAGISVTGETMPATFEPSTPDWQFDPGANVWRRGSAFASWALHAIPAHVGRLCAYAVLEAQQTNEQAALAFYALRIRTLPTAYRGAAPTLAGLDGKWAWPGVGYGAAIANVANKLRESA